MNRKSLRALIPVLAGLLGAVALALFLLNHGESGLKQRVPGTDQAGGLVGAGAINAPAAGKLVKGDGTPSTLPGDWPCFRGPNRDGISPETPARSWAQGGPRELWSTAVGEGYGGPAVVRGRVYLMDYDRDKHESAVRCLSLADGKEIWRYFYPLSVKRNHGMTRTVPTVVDKFVVAMDPKCNVVCVDADTGEFRWALNLVHDCGTTIPPWYAGQCPLVDGSAVILAPAGPNALLMAVDLKTGSPIWKTSNPRGWNMTHSSIVPTEFDGKRMYLYCGSGGVAGISAQTGELLWDSTAWKISIATVPSPVPVGEGKIFLSGGYNAGCMMLELKKEGAKIVAQSRFRLGPEVFGATQQTPVFHDGFIFGIRPDGQFACIDANGKAVWASGPGTQFGLGPLFMAGGGTLFAMNDSGRLTLMEASPAKCTVLAQAQVIKDGHESWGPMALAGGRLLVRDFTRLICLDLSVK